MICLLFEEQAALPFMNCFAEEEVLRIKTLLNDTFDSLASTLNIDGKWAIPIFQAMEKKHTPIKAISLNAASFCRQ